MSDPGPLSYPVRLNRYISACGCASRRKAEELILAGRVTVDDQAEMSVGRVLTGPADVRVDGRQVRPAKQVYIVMNKPRGVISAASDRRGRTVVDLLPEFYGSLGVFPVGRLDKESEGLIILTNDGKFAQELIHPSAGVKRIYEVFLRKDLDHDGVKKWADGVMIEGRFAKPLELRPLEGVPGRRFEVALGEGFKREIRMMALALGNRVVSLTRIGMGNLFLRKLPLGAFNEYNYNDLMKMISVGGEI
jgi:23S rRNA pseudouridine2605 synthase